MEERDIKPNQCYRLDNGQIIRVMTVRSEQVRYDSFDSRQKKWVQSPAPVPVRVVKEPCADPTKEV